MWSVHRSEAKSSIIQTALAFIHSKDSRRQNSFFHRIFDSPRSRLLYRPIHHKWIGLAHCSLAMKIDKECLCLEIAGAGKKHEALARSGSREISLPWKWNFAAMPAHGSKIKFCQLILICKFFEYFSPWQVNLSSPIDLPDQCPTTNKTKKRENPNWNFFFLFLFISRFEWKKTRMRTPKPQCAGSKNTQTIHRDW